MNEWSGPSKKASMNAQIAVEASNCLVSFASNLTLTSALERIKMYETAYNEHFTQTAINLTLLSVSGITRQPQSLLNALGVALAEELPTKADEIGL